MRVLITVPDRVFRQAQRHARHFGKSISQLFAVALTEYLAQHETDGNAKNPAGPQERASRDSGDRFTDNQIGQWACKKSAQESWFEEPTVDLSKRNSRRVLKLLKHPPAPNAKLRRAAQALPERS